MAKATDVSVIARALQEVLDRNQVRQLIQELVSYETDVAVSKTPGSIGTSRLESKRIALALAGECTCACVCSWMNPALWSTLPEELLQLVFARLPLPKISELRSLSKQWNRSFTSEDTEFMRACTEANPRMFAMITQGFEPEHISVRSFDIKADRWYSFDQPVAEGNFVTMCAGDGGLVCMVSIAVKTNENPLVITVFNPLTRKRRLLSPHALRKVQPRMVQLVMDEDTKCYKVIVVGEKRLPGGHGTHVVAEVYCSETGVWSGAMAFPDLIIGNQYRWDKSVDVVSQGVLEDTILGPCACDCAGSQLVEFDVQRTPVHDRRFRGAPIESYALMKDRLFVLHRKLVERIGISGFVCQRIHYVVSEYQYQGPNCEPNLVELRVHEFIRPPLAVRYHMELYACRGFLLIQATNNERLTYDHDLAWLYDLSTTEWQKVPAIPFPGSFDDAMFELRWDVVS